MADYDRRNSGARGGYNNNRKRRYRGTIPEHLRYTCLELTFARRR